MPTARHMHTHCTHRHTDAPPGACSSSSSAADAAATATAASSTSAAAAQRPRPRLRWPPAAAAGAPAPARCRGMVVAGSCCCCLVWWRVWALLQASSRGVGLRRRDVWAANVGVGATAAFCLGVLQPEVVCLLYAVGLHFLLLSTRFERDLSHLAGILALPSASTHSHTRKTTRHLRCIPSSAAGRPERAARCGAPFASPNAQTSRQTNERMATNSEPHVRSPSYASIYFLRQNIDPRHCANLPPPHSRRRVPPPTF